MTSQFLKKSILINKRKMSVNIFGNGHINVVILCGLGAKNPLNDFELLINKFVNNHSLKIILIEYFGCGTSDDTCEKRSNQNIVNEIRFVLKSLELDPPYILIPHSISGLYSLYYANKYPDEIFALIGIDISTPKLCLEYFKGDRYRQYSLDEVKNIGITMAHLNEWNEIINNAKELENTKYPKNLNVISFLSSYNVNEMEKAVKEKLVTRNWIEMHKDMIINPKIQTIQVLEGNHWLHRNQYNRIYKESEDIIKKYGADDRTRTCTELPTRT